MQPSILIVEDDVTFSLMLKTWLGRKGFLVESQTSVSDAQKCLDSRSFQLVLSDLRLPDRDGIELLKWLKETHPDVALIMMTSYADIHTAVQAIKLGASDYISKPVNPEELLTKIKETIKVPELSTGKSTKTAAGNAVSNPYIEGVSQAAVSMYEHVRLVAPTDMSVLITGSSGTGKEYVARRIHEQSNRANAPFVAVDCGAIPKDLAASEFFGHVKGSFTDAHADRIGRFEAADGGTLFLDEIANLPYYLQAKLLTAIQKRSFIKVGSNTPQPTNIRLICATNRDLDEMVRKGEFREDLLYRINTIHLHIPSLRERKEDILPLARLFLERYAKQYGRTNGTFAPDAAARLLAHPWYGNIRELQHTIEKAVILSDSGELRAESLQLPVAEKVETAVVEEKEKIAFHTLDEMERTMIQQALDQCGSNLSQAAAKLGITRQTLYNKMKRYGL